MTLSRLRLLLWVLVALALAGFALLLLVPRPVAEPTAQLVDAKSFGGPFTLTAGDGTPFSSTRLDGRPHAIFFGFTNCPDVCPTTLARMVKLRRQAGGDSALDLLFITVDPERDGPAEVGKYAQLFDSPVIGLTGSPAQIEQVKQQYGVFSQKVGEGDAYNVDHSASVFLFDAKGDFVATISPAEPDAAALAKLRRIAS